MRAFILSPALAAMLVGCISFGGGDANVQVNDTSISKGRELTDLQRALQAQAITQAEYEHLHEVILRRPN